MVNSDAKKDKATKLQGAKKLGTLGFVLGGVFGLFGGPPGLLAGICIGSLVGSAVGAASPKISNFVADKFTSALNVAGKKATELSGSLAKKALGEEKYSKVEQVLEKAAKPFSAIKNALKNNKEEGRTALDFVKNVGRSGAKGLLVGGLISAVLAFTPLAPIAPLVIAAVVGGGVVSGAFKESYHQIKQSSSFLKSKNSEAGDDQSNGSELGNKQSTIDHANNQDNEPQKEDDKKRQRASSAPASIGDPSVSPNKLAPNNAHKVNPSENPIPSSTPDANEHVQSQNQQR